ncbi:MAG: hypothetical protein KDD06_27605 [Phaeodactylibacter sp.]|nr:hypothetical protein [Phaeodactylibacter sp.]MCB9267368.1 hypothetical protein [Lewinellaceae bacterium]MCB9289184.1 hypothetical protein [Lewinellaceae bacterium]
MYKHLKITFLTLLAPALLVAQELRIEYDVQKDSLAYFRDGQPVKRAIARKGENVTLQIRNYNNYIYKVQVDEENHETRVAPVMGAGLGSFLGGPGGGSPLSMFSGLFNLPGGQTSFPIEDFGGGFDDGDGFVTSESAKAANALFKQFSQTTRLIKGTEKDLRTIGNEMNRIAQGQRVKEIAAGEIEKLRYNPALPPTQIRRLSMEYLETILGQESDIQNLEELLEKASTGEELSQKLELYNKYTDELAGYYELVGWMRDSMSQIALSTDKFAEFQDAIASFYGSGNTNIEQYREMAHVAEEALASMENYKLEQLIQLRYILEELKANTFSHTFRTQAKGDRLKINLRLDPLDSLRTPGISARKLSALDIPVYGGFKVNASIGVSFGSFFNQPQAFFLRDSLIVSEDKDSYLPIVTSFIHFYSQSARSLSVGGAFGVGLSIGGDNGAQSIHFMLGPSFILGEGQRVAFSAGLMGGKVDRLGQGYKVGDRLISEAGALPIRSVYEMGMFIGLSFNVLSN